MDQRQKSIATRDLYKLPYKTQSEQEQIQHIKWCFKSMACRLTTIGCWIHCNSSQTEYNWYVVYMYNTLDVDFTLYYHSQACI